MFKKAIDLLYTAKQHEIDILLNGEQLQLKLPKNKNIDKGLLAEIKDNKDLIIDFLRSNKKSDKNSTTIKKFNREIGQKIPLSYSQERLWFIDRLEGSNQYHIVTVLKLEGKLDKQALDNSLKGIVNRHEILRTIYLDIGGKAYQNIKSGEEWELDHINGTEYRNNRENLQILIEKLITKPFDLSKDYMIRAHLVDLDLEEYYLVVTLHHIASDGWSSSIIVREIDHLYNSFINNHSVELEPLPFQYSDYALWQRSYLQGDVLNNKVNYWKGKLEGVEPLQLPSDYPRPAIQSTRGAIKTFNIDHIIAAQIKELGRKEGATLFMTLLAALKLLLHYYTGQNNICVGTPIAGRQYQELENLIGFFVNTLALKTGINNDLSFYEFLAEVKTTTLEGYEHQDLPFEKVVEAVVKERDISRSPLFQVMFVLQNTPKKGVLKLGEAQLTSESYNRNYSKFDLTFYISEKSGGFTGAVEYSTALFSEETIGRMIEHYKKLLSAIVENPFQKIEDFEILTEEESQLIATFNDTKSEYPLQKSIVSLFEEQVVNSPEAIALIFERVQVSYKELNARANQIAHYLISRGVGKEKLVPICIDRSIELIAGILGILKAGAAYVPVDPDYPLERIRYMLQDTGADIVLSSGQTKARLTELENFEVLELDTNELIVEQLETNTKVDIATDNLAYVIYTSGSTGKPKGVLVEHSNVVSLVKGVDYVSLNQDAVLLSTGSLSFDATTFEYWGMLLNGGQLIFCRENSMLDSELLKQEIDIRGVNIMWFTSSWFNSLVDNNIDVFESLATILVGGEKLSEPHIEKFRTTYTDIKLINGYGPTENTTFSLTYPIKKLEIKNQIPIGRPINNRSAYILNQVKKPVPIGVKGEIYLGGAGLSRGYLNQETLTAEKFVNISLKENDNLRLYRTGDIGRLLAGGDIEFAGRLDEQVKIRGYRVELGEIESVILQSDFVSQAVVVAVEDKQGSHKRLVGYIVANGGFDKEALNSYMNSKLPLYMIPATWIELSTLPLTANGKVDKNALPKVEANELTGKEFVAPRNVIEVELAEIWKRVLGLESISINDNFFEIGGDSILTIQVISQVKKGGHILQPKDLFINQTIKSLAGVLAERSADFKNGSIAAIYDTRNEFQTEKRQFVKNDNFKYLVPVKVGKDKLPLYIVCGGGGTVIKFKKMVDLLDYNQPVFGLQQPTDIFDLENFPDTIEQIAATYVSEILLQNPNGPYAISGHCAGGIIAYEMSKQLQEMGKKVVFLAMFDTIATGIRPIRKKSLKNLYFIPETIKKSILKIYLKIDFETFLLRKHTKHAIEYKINNLRSFLTSKRYRNNEDQVYEVYRRLENSFKHAKQKYKLSPNNSNIIVYYAKNHYRFLDYKRNVSYRRFSLHDSIKNRWKKYAKSVEIFEVEGEHSTMFDPVIGGGKELAELLQTHLDASSNR